MKKLLLILTLFAPCIAFAGSPAKSVRVDFTGMQFTNWCTGEKVTVTGGDFVLVYREEINGSVSGIHVLNKAAGSVTAIGNDTGHEYRVNIAGEDPTAWVPEISVLNFHNGIGSLSVVIHGEVIDLSNPGSGISQVKVIVVIGFDGSGSGGTRIWESSTGCVGG